MSYRYYQIGDKQYVSVTTALSIIRKPFLERWRGELGNEEADRIRDEAGELGSVVHDMCQSLDAGTAFIGSANDTAWAIIQAYQQWTKAMVKEWIKIEEVVSCDHYWYAGRVDRVAILKGDRNKPTVIDLKTSGYIGKEMGLQLAAYQHCLEDIGIKPKRRIIVQLDKEVPGNPVKVHEFPDYATDFRMFLYALELFRHFEGGNKKDVYVISA